MFCAHHSFTKTIVNQNSTIHQSLTLWHFAFFIQSLYNQSFCAKNCLCGRLTAKHQPYLMNTHIVI